MSQKDYARRLADDRILRDTMEKVMDGHYRGGDEYSRQRMINSSTRTVYRISEHAVLKLYPPMFDSPTTKEKIENELALFDYFDEIGIPVPDFSFMVTSDHKHGIVTQDLTHNGKCELKEFAPENYGGLKNSRELLVKAVLEWTDFFSEKGFDGVPYVGLFIKINEEKEGELVFADLDNLDSRSFSDPTLPDKIMKQFYDKYPNGEYEIKIR
ncbi:MAG: hypothetical protein J7J38_00765 [Candidatus Aenigmarchaeota archaeon]|nr:hypothetical protein [Candidatus Aenigmarchaeota archaeon]